MNKSDATEILEKIVGLNRLYATKPYDGGYCANRLVLSTLLPLNHAVVKSGRSRRFKLAGVDVVFNHTEIISSFNTLYKKWYGDRSFENYIAKEGFKNRLVQQSLE